MPFLAKSNIGELSCRSGMPTRASRLLQQHDRLLSDADLVGRVTSSLLKGEFFEQAGELYERVGQQGAALDCYRRGEIYAKAVELARHYLPNEVVGLEEEWGDHLVQSKQLDAAINHFIEAGRTMKALDAAIAARQWKKAVQIIQARIFYYFSIIIVQYFMPAHSTQRSSQYLCFWFL